MLVDAPAIGQTTWTVSNNPFENQDFPGLWEALQSPLVVNGDTIEVSQGLGAYYPPMNEYYSFNGRAITIRARSNQRPVLGSNWPGAPVVGTTFLFSGEGPDSVLDGFDFSPGGQSTIVVAGGSPTIRNCLFKQSGRDAVVRVSGGHPRFENCTFSGCSGMFNQYIVVTPRRRSSDA